MAKVASARYNVRRKENEGGWAPVAGDDDYDDDDGGGSERPAEKAALAGGTVLK